MKNKKLENSIKSLVNLYTVVIGASLTLAVANAIDVHAGLGSVSSISIFLFISFVATLFPFFHGALRHLDDAFIESPNSNIKAGALIIDFALLFLHALAFVVLSQLLQRPAHFAWVLIVILSIDVVWGVFAHFGSSSGGRVSAEWKWTIINFVFIAIIAAYMVSNDIYLNFAQDTLKHAVLLMIACLLRSAVDYVSCKDLYFPTTK